MGIVINEFSYKTVYAVQLFPQVARGSQGRQNIILLSIYSIMNVERLSIGLLAGNTTLVGHSA